MNTSPVPVSNSNNSQIVNQDYLQFRVDKLETNLESVKSEGKRNHKDYRAFKSSIEAKMDNFIEIVGRQFNIVFERLDGLDAKFNSLSSQFEVFEKRLDQLATQFETFEKRLNQLATQFETFERRLDQLAARFGTFENKLNKILEKIDK